MNEECCFAIYEFRYKNKNNLPLVVYSRTEETADIVVSYFNDGLDKKEQWYKPRFFFKKTMFTNVEPYVLEQMQIDSAIEMNKHRKQYMKEHKEQTLV